MKLHSKFGVNPTVPKCFWCGESKNEIVLLGAAFRGEAPRSMVLDYEPCDECALKMSTGITFMEATMRNGKPEPTGTFVVMKDTSEFLQRIDADMLAGVMQSRKCFLDSEAWDELGFPRSTDSEVGK